MAPSDGACWCTLSDVAWYYILKQIPWRDIGHCRATCRCWRRDVDRCLHRLHLRDPTPDCLIQLGKTFTQLSSVKLTAQREDVRLDELFELPGALGRAGALRLRSKRPGGGMLAVGHLHLLQTAGSVLTVLNLRSCEITSWTGLQTCKNLAHLQLIYCRFSESACVGLTRALAGLPSLTSLELRSASGRASSGNLHYHQNPHQYQQQFQHQHQQQEAPNNQDSHQHQHLYRRRHDHQHYATGHNAPCIVPRLTGLGSWAPRLAVLKLAASFPEAVLQGLLRLELPNIRNLQELDLELHAVASVRQGLQEHVHHGLGDHGSLGAAASSYKELSALIPVICVAAPHLTFLRIKGHSRLQDRDLQLLQPLRQLRHLSLDLSHPETAALRPPPQQHQQQQQLQIHANADETFAPLPAPLSGVGVATMLHGTAGLQALSLSHSAWLPEGLKALSESTSLTQLRLAGAQLPKGFTLCNFLYSFRSLQNLVELDLGGCTGLTDWGLALIGRCAMRLLRLNVGGCGDLAGDVGVAALAPLMGRLQHLDLSFTDKLTDRGLAGMLRNGAPALQFLSLDYCTHVQDGVLHVAASCPSLQQLRLDYCVRVSATGIAALRNLRELRRLSVEGCVPAVQTAVAGMSASRPKRSHAAARWWLAV